MIGIVGLFLSACSGSSGTTASRSTVSATSSATSDTVLRDENGALTVRAGSFTSDLAITYTSGTASTSDIENATLISTPVTITFSSAVAVTGTSPMTLTLNMSPGDYAAAIAAERSIYALVKMEGDELGLDIGDNSATWIPVIGAPDAASETLSISLMASAGTINAVAVSGTGLTLAAAGDPVADVSTASTSSRVTSNAEETLGEHTWAVVCEKNLLSDGGSASCNTTRFDPSLGIDPSPVLTLVDSLNTVTSSLAASGFTTALLHQATVQNLINSNISGAPTKDELNAMADKSAIYNIAYFTDSHKQCKHDDSLACYMHSSGIIAFGETFDDPPQLSDGSDVVAHELTHAVQAKSCPSCSVRDADGNRPYVGFVEGTAEFVGQYFNAGLSAAEVKNRGTASGVSRNWTMPLGHVSKDDVPYETFEFYALALDGNISLLPQLFEGFESATNQIFNKRLNTAFNQAAREAFIKAVALRNILSINQTNYVSFQGDPDWDPVSDMVKTFAANHYYASAPFSDTNCFSRIQITSGGNDYLAAIVVSPLIYDGATTIDLENGLFANYVIGDTDMAISRQAGGSCGLDVIVANANPDGDAEEEMGYSLLVGFD